MSSGGLALEDLVFRTTDPARWGDGKGAVLTKEEGDANLYTLASAIMELQENPALPDEITNVTVDDDNAITFHLASGATLGPIPLPVASVDFTGVWVSGTAYIPGNIFTYGNSVYKVNVPFTATGDFNPDATTGAGAPYVTHIMDFTGGEVPSESTSESTSEGSGDDEPELIVASMMYPGKPGDGLPSGAAFMGYQVPDDCWISNDYGGYAYAYTAPTSDISYPIYYEDTQIGTIDFTAGNSEAAVSFSGTWQMSSVRHMRVLRADSVDPTLTEIYLTVWIVKGTAP